jgi:RNA polymerase sigma-70 factor (ECF subfamily)
MLAYLVRETRDPELAADIAGEVFATVIVTARRYRPETDSAAPWLIGIARNTLAASRRRGRTQDRARKRLQIEPLEFDDDDYAETDAMAGRAGGGVVELVAGLPGDERHAVEARVVQERSYSDIAEQLHCSEMVVRKRVSRGLSRVRRRLEGR